MSLTPADSLCAYMWGREKGERERCVQENGRMVCLALHHALSWNLSMRTRSNYKEHNLLLLPNTRDRDAFHVYVHRGVLCVWSGLTLQRATQASDVLSPWARGSDACGYTDNIVQWLYHFSKQDPRWRHSRLVVSTVTSQTLFVTGGIFVWRFMVR